MAAATRKEALAALKKHKTYRAAAAALNMPTTTLQNRLRGCKPKRQKPEIAVPELRRTGKRLEEFRASYDKDFIVPRKIREGLKALAGGWDYETGFAKLAGISLTDLANYRDAFSDYLVIVRRDGKRAWAATPTLAAQMRMMIS